MKRNLLLFCFISFLMTSCIPLKKIKLVQDQGNLESDNEGFAKIYRTEYTIRVNDILRVNIISRDNQAQKVFGQYIGDNSAFVAVTPANLYIQALSVDLNGKIEIPVIGEVNVEGLTLEEAKMEVDKKINNIIFKENTYSVSIKIAGIQFSILGEVVNQGTYSAFQNQLNILEAVSQARGLTFTADRENILLHRQTPKGIKIYKINLTDNNIINQPEFFIQPNDIIVVHPLKQKSWGIGTTGIQTFATSIGILSSTLTSYLLIRDRL